MLCVFFTYFMSDWFFLFFLLLVYIFSVACDDVEELKLDELDEVKKDDEELDDEFDENIIGFSKYNARFVT